MSRNLLLILAETTEGSAVRRALVNSRDGPFNVEWVSRCGGALERLGRQGGEDFAAVVVDLFLPDSQGIETFDKLYRAAPHIPILSGAACATRMPRDLPFSAERKTICWPSASTTIRCQRL